MSRLLATVVLLVLALAGCNRQSSAERLLRSEDLSALYQSNAANVEQVLGQPDERTADGAMTYREVRIGRSRRPETLTLHVTNGVVSRICRSDS